MNESIEKEIKELGESNKNMGWKSHPFIKKNFNEAEGFTNFMNEYIRYIAQQAREEEREKRARVKKDLVARMTHKDFEGCYVCEETLHHLSALELKDEEE